MRGGCWRESHPWDTSTPGTTRPPPAPPRAAPGFDPTRRPKNVHKHRCQHRDHCRRCHGTYACWQPGPTLATPNVTIGLFIVISTTVTHCFERMLSPVHSASHCPGTALCAGAPVRCFMALFSRASEIGYCIKTEGITISLASTSQHSACVPIATHGLAAQAVPKRPGADRKRAAGHHAG